MHGCLNHWQPILENVKLRSIGFNASFREMPKVVSITLRYGKDCVWSWPRSEQVRQCILLQVGPLDHVGLLVGSFMNSLDRAITKTL